MHSLKPLVRALTAALALLALPAPALAGPEGHTPKHGGIVVQGKAFDIELVAQPDLIHVHLSDHGKPLNMDGVGGKVTLLAGSEKSEATLTLAGGVLTAKGRFKTAGAKAVVVITRPRQAPVTARFVLK